MKKPPSRFFSRWQDQPVKAEPEAFGPLVRPHGQSPRLAGPNFSFPAAGAQRFRFSNSGSSLVTTLLVVTILTIIVVAFMQSMSIERMTSRSYANVERARLAAEAGVNDAMVKISNLMSENTWHAIGYQRSGTGPAYPILFGSTNYNQAPRAFQLVSNTNSLVPLPALTVTNSADLNRLNEKSAQLGWIGTPAEKVNGAWRQEPVEMRAPWIEILADPTRPNQPNPNQPNYNPVVQRFAYWVEDETAKLDLPLIGNSDGPDGAFSRQSEPARSPRQLDIGALPWNNGTPLQVSDGNQGMVSFLRQLDPLPNDDKAVNFHEVDAFPEEPWDTIKFHATRHSVSNELSGTGKRRANLNHIVTNSNDPNVIAADLDDIIFVITGQHIFGGSSFHDLSNGAHQGVFLDQPTEIGPMPSFGQRFYTTPDMLPPSSDLKEDHEKTYLLKIAANIRDYIDSDSQPTFVNADGQVEAGQRREFSWRPGEEPIALGKEAIPYFQEHVWKARLENIDLVPGTNPSNRRRVSFTTDHYLEFYNPSTKAWIAPIGTELKIYNLPDVRRGQFPNFSLNDIILDLSGAVFPAGATVIVTTSPNSGEDPPGLINSSALVLRSGVHENSRAYKNIIANQQIGSDTGANRRFGINLWYRNSVVTDYQSEFVLSTNEGVIDAFPFLSLPGVQDPKNGTIPPFEFSRSENLTTCTWRLPVDERERRFVFASSLAGNGNFVLSRTGDPRSLSEPLQLVAGAASLGNDQGRFFSVYRGALPSQRDQLLPGQHSPSGNPRITLGNPANPEFVSPADWPDYHVALANSANTSYAVIADEPMKSIGELGHIYDPHRKLDPDSPFGIRTARGGGRTLKTGQIDDVVNPSGRFSPATENHVSWFNGAWRLTDIFSADDVNLPESAPAAPGKININGILRDGGTAFRAALRGLRFLPAPDGDSARANNLLTEPEIDVLVEQAMNYLRTNGPMMCRGELGQLPFFSAAGEQGRAGGQPSSTSMDRSREEIFRRIVELITTRSLSFRVFAVGQAVRQNPNGTIEPTSTNFQQALINFDPQINSAPNSRVESYQAHITYVQP